MNKVKEMNCCPMKNQALGEKLQISLVKEQL